MIGIKIIGDWRTVGNALDELPQRVRLAANKGQLKAAKKLVALVKGHINSQDLGWEERAESTHSDDPRILVDSGAYYKAIKVFGTSTIYAGVKKNEYNYKGARIADYAILHEHGGGKFPARPVWAPSLQDLGGRVGIRRIVFAAIQEKVAILRSKGFSVDVSL